MSAKKYDCPACGGIMEEFRPGEPQCGKCLLWIRPQDARAIEAHTLARIAEAERPLVEAMESARSAMYAVAVNDSDDLRTLQDGFDALGRSIAAYKARAAERGGK